jgi:aryl-alcohol dehydrogenase-like predicted oxidoreductase
MKKIGKFSAMTLGTVQLGMNYGIANTDGKPSEEKSFSILQAALDGGITALDTARAYGDSEQVIGRFLKQYKGATPAIVTKIRKLEGSTPKELEKFVTDSIETSLENLGVNKVDAVMLHGAQDPVIHGRACADAVKSLLDHGYTDQVGVSVYTAEDIEGMLPYDIFSVTQVPMSIFDQRLIAGGSIAKLKERNYTVFVRSVFLQGLFFLNPDEMTDPILLEHAAPKIRLLREIAAAEGLTVEQLAIAFMRDLPGVTSLVLGADTPEQVRANIAAFETPVLDDAVSARLQQEFSEVDIPAIMQVLSRPKK